MSINYIQYDHQCLSRLLALGLGGALIREIRRHADENAPYFIELQLADGFFVSHE